MMLPVFTVFVLLIGISQQQQDQQLDYRQFFGRQIEKFYHPDPVDTADDDQRHQFATLTFINTDAVDRTKCVFMTYDSNGNPIFAGSVQEGHPSVDKAVNCIVVRLEQTVKKMESLLRDAVAMCTNLSVYFGQNPKQVILFSWLRPCSHNRSRQEVSDCQQHIATVLNEQPLNQIGRRIVAYSRLPPSPPESKNQADDHNDFVRIMKDAGIEVFPALQLNHRYRREVSEQPKDVTVNGDRVKFNTRCIKRRGDSYTWAETDHGTYSWDYCCESECVNGQCWVGDHYEYCGTPGRRTVNGQQCTENHICGLHGQKYYWCYTGPNYWDWDYCCRSEAETNSKQSTGVASCDVYRIGSFQMEYSTSHVTVSGDRCSKYHACAYYKDLTHHPSPYFWCYKPDGNWDYCCEPSAYGCSQIDPYWYSRKYCYTNYQHTSWSYCYY